MPEGWKKDTLSEICYLKKNAPNETEAKEEELAQEIDTESHEKAENFSFSKCQIPIGAELEYCADDILQFSLKFIKIYQF